MEKLLIRIQHYEAIALYHAVRRAPEKEWPALESRFRFEIVLLDASKPINIKMLRFFARHPGWQLVSVEGYRVLFLRRGVFALSQSLEKFEGHLKSFKISKEDLEQIRRESSFVSVPFLLRLKKFLVPEPIYVDTFEEGITLFDMGYKEAGIFYLRRSLPVMNKEYALRVLQWAAGHLKE